MKKHLILLLVCSLFYNIQVKAQKELLPFGQTTQKPWTASYFYAPKNGETPPDNWFAPDFDDSEWETIEGPISTSNGIDYYSTLWASSNATYWLRRHFIVSELAEYPFLYLYVRHNDGCEIYLNGSQIYKDDKYYTNLVTVPMTEEMCSHFVDGDNVIAVKVNDSRGGQAFIDFGIEANNVSTLANPNFNNGTNGWTWTGSGYQSGGQSSNPVARYKTAKPFNVHQKVVSSQCGLFRLKAQAFEAFSGDQSTGWESYGTIPVSSFLYISDTQQKVKNIFDETVSTNIYSDYYKTKDNTYIPTSMNSVSIAFLEGMYENEIFAYIDTTSFDIGIAQTMQLDLERWVCFDNFQLEYLSEKAITNLVKDIEEHPMESSCKERMSLLLTNLNTASKYEDKCKIIAASSYDVINALKSISQYALIQEAVNALQQQLNTGSNMPEEAIAEAEAIIASTNTRLSEGKISASETQSLLNQLKELSNRLNYMYLSVNLTEPGSLGDAILNKTEYFTNVVSLKVSGQLNDADLAIIRDRLTNLREINMTDVKMTILPDKFFYQHSLLERVKLPASLQVIGNLAFYKCSGIKQIDFPETLQTINEYAFQDCDKLQEVVLPEGLITLGDGAFYSCEDILQLKLPSTLKEISYCAFYGNSNLKTIDFAEGLTKINNAAFYNCSALNNLIFPSTLLYINEGAFAYNSALSQIEFNEGLYQIEDNAFYSCDALTEVTLPSTLVLAYESPFDYCDNLRKVTCLSIDPPYMTDQIPLGVSMEGRELYVPALSINTYKQTKGWDKFQTIKPIDYLPESLVIHNEVKLTLPESLPSDYKPEVIVAYSNNPYFMGSLVMNGSVTLPMSSFQMLWSPNNQYVYSDDRINYGSLINNSDLSSDEVFIIFNTRNDNWSFISFPFDVKISEILAINEGTTNWVIRKYDGQKRASGETSSTWVKMSGDDILNAGEGYIIQSSRYVDNDWQYYSVFEIKAIDNVNKNNIFRKDDITVTLKEYNSEYSHNRSWNLIGNPYPCYFDTRFIHFEAPITVWNMEKRTYEAYSLLDDSYILCPGEAFFVQRPVANGNIIFSKDGRQTNRDVRTIEAPAHASANKANAALSPRTIVNLNLSDGNNTDRTRIVLNENASLQYEMDKDASKFLSTEPSVSQIYTSANGVNYAINERPFADGLVNLTTYFGSEGLYTITLSNKVSDYKIILEDKTENKSIVLTEGFGYTFYAKAGTDMGRFVIHFDGETTNIEDVRLNESGYAPIYSIDGIKVDVPTKKGIYIQNGKKVMINK